jgi:hypothetical protein
MNIPKKPEWKTRLVQRDFPDRSVDIEFWQEQGDEAIFAAAWAHRTLPPPQPLAEWQSEERAVCVLQSSSGAARRLISLCSPCSRAQAWGCNGTFRQRLIATSEE